MIFIDQRATDPYFNLALEEHLFKGDEDVVMLWQSKNAIVVGKHQNTLSEINYPVVLDQGIDVARRLSGGGTVYHDLGNLNFTFIQTGEREKLVDFKKFLDPVMKALNAMGLETYQGKRNEIMLAGKKISGNAEHTFKNRVLHHGTLLFNSNISTLIKSLRVNPLKFQDKAIKSVQSRVTNISDHLSGIDFEQFREWLATSLKEQFGIEKDYELSSTDITEVENLIDQKYKTWDWIFGYSPSYVLAKTIELSEEELELEISVKKGLIENITSHPGELNGALNKFKGQPHKLQLFEEMELPEGLRAIDFF